MFDKPKAPQAPTPRPPDKEIYGSLKFRVSDDERMCELVCPKLTADMFPDEALELAASLTQFAKWFRETEDAEMEYARRRFAPTTYIEWAQKHG